MLWLREVTRACRGARANLRHCREFVALISANPIAVCLVLAVLRNQAVTTTRPRRALDSRALSGRAHQTHPLHGAPPSNTMHQHLTPLRTRVPEISSDFALLCACAHSDATFYEANSSRTAARSVNGRRQSPAAIAIDHRPSPRHRSDYDLSYHLGRCFEVCLPRPISHGSRLTHGVCRSRVPGLEAARRLGGGGQRRGQR